MAERVAPLSYGQERLWFMDRLLGSDTTYNLSSVMWIRGRLDVSALEAAVAEIVARHEVLRTRLSEQSDGSLVQVVDEVPALVVQCIDLREDQARERMESVLHRPFELAAEPAFRAVLLRLSPDSHRLVLVWHHTAFDQGSVLLFHRELRLLYTAFHEGDPSPLPPLPLQYGDFAIGQRARLDGEGMRRHVSYWTRALAGLSSAPRLFPPAPGRSRESRVKSSLDFKIPGTLVGDLMAVGTTERATPFMVMLAGWCALLRRYARRDRIFIRTPVSLRDLSGAEPLIGFFVNTIVICGDVSGAPSFREVVQRVRRAAIGAFAHREMPFNKVVELVGPGEVAISGALSELGFRMIQWSNLTDQWTSEGIGPYEWNPALPGLQVEVENVDPPLIELSLTLVLAEERDGMSASLEYGRGELDPALVSGMASSFVRLLAGAAADPDRPLSAVLLLDDETAALRASQRRGARAAPDHTTIHQLIEAQAEQAGARVALVDGDHQLTYADLNRRANRLAHHLRSLGVGPDVIVGLCMRPAVETWLCMLGILKAGGACLRIDDRIPREQWGPALRAAGASVVVTEQATATELDLPAERRVLIDADWPASAMEHELCSSVTPDNLAYLVCTWKPDLGLRLVAGTHGGAVNYLAWAATAYELSREPHALYSLRGLDPAALSLYAALAAGRTVRVVPEPTVLGEALAVGGYSLARLASEELEWCARRLPLGAIARATRWVVTHGETLPDNVLTLLGRFRAGLRVMIEYGQAEAAGTCAAFELPRRGTRSGRLPVGQPIRNVDLFVLDEHLRPVPEGAVGELFVAGSGLTRCYAGDASATAQAFLANPYADQPGDRLFRTRDLVRWREDGRLDVVERASSEVDTGAYARPRSPGAPFIAPRSPLETTIAGELARALRTEAVSADDDFFALGANSVLVAQLASALAKEHGLKIPLQSFFTARTVSGLAALVETIEDGGR